MKKLCLMMALLLGLTLVTGCGKPGGQSGAEQNSPAASPSSSEPVPSDNPSTPDAPASFLEGKTKLVMATEAGFAPYEYYDDSNHIVGVDVDIAQAIADHLGLELEVIDMKFDTITLEVDSGRADLGAAGMSVDPERQKVVDFSIPYATSKQIVVVKEGSEITGPDGLDGKTVGVQLGTVADLALAEDYPGVTLAQYDKYFEAVSDLVNGRIDAIVMDILPAQEFVGSQEGLVILEEELFTDEYAICVKKGNQELLDAVNTVLGELISSGKVDEFTMNHTVS